LSFPPPLAAGVVNVTSDSFFPGARSGTPEQAVADGLRLVAEGFDLIDVGAVAARSGPPVPPAEEAANLAPAIAGLVEQAGIPVLADTFSVDVARAALDAGAAAINDISGG
jgi:dihydropteroate synthase